MYKIVIHDNTYTNYDVVYSHSFEKREMNIDPITLKCSTMICLIMTKNHNLLQSNIV